jgi:putative endonuclease
MPKDDRWSVYIVQCADGSLYTGVTTDIKRRVREHNESKKGAKYTRPRRPVHLLCSMSSLSQSAALKLEAEIKSLRKVQKVQRMVELIEAKSQSN